MNLAEQKWKLSADHYERIHNSKYRRIEIQAYIIANINELYIFSTPNKSMLIDLMVNKYL